jgi:hypothetical protein
VDLKDIVDESIEVGHGDTRLSLRLRHCLGAPSGADAVLLMHGGNTLSDIYFHPEGRSLADHLISKGNDVWLLDWRASPFVVDTLIREGAPLGGSVFAECMAYTMDSVVDEDIPAALRAIRGHIGQEPALSVVAWCLSSGAISMALARGKLEEARVKSVVLMTLGLFYQVPWNGWLKAEDFIFERILHEEATCRGVSPNTPKLWPKAMEGGYQGWPQAWLPGDAAQRDHLLPRLTFMVGQPYSHDRLEHSLRDRPLNRFFGNLHVGLYLHISQMVRRGYASRFNAPEVIAPRRGRSSTQPGEAAESDLRPEFFIDKHITLISAARDRVWHRESLDLMYDWLRRIGCRDVVKNVVAADNIVELLWGTEPTSVFKLVEKGVESKRR